MEIAESAVQRDLTDAECRAIVFDACGPAIDVPENLPLRGGMDSYGASAPGPTALEGTTVRLSANTLSDHYTSALQLAEFTERTGITVEFMPEEAQAPLNRGFVEPNRRPDVLLRRCDPDVGRSPRARHRPVHRSRHSAIGLRPVPAERRDDGRCRWRTPRRRSRSLRFR